MNLVDGGNLQEWMDDERLYMGTDGEEMFGLVMGNGIIPTPGVRLTQRGYCETGRAE